MKMNVRGTGRYIHRRDFNGVRTRTRTAQALLEREGGSGTLSILQLPILGCFYCKQHYMLQEMVSDSSSELKVVIWPASTG